MAFDLYGNPLINTFDVVGNVYDPYKNWFINQCGYDADKAKRATFIYAPDGTAFTVKSADDNRIVYTGTLSKQIADFSAVQTNGEYYLECDGIASYHFDISDNRAWNVQAKQAVKFMEMSRQDVWDVGGATGYAWRDSHQFSFELNNLVLMYLADPDYWESLPWDVYRVADTEYTELKTQDCPNIIWLMKFGVMRYYDWNVNDGINLHALIKGQIAYFLWLYPHISDYVDAEWYATIRDWCISIWGNTTCNKLWYEVAGGINHNMFLTQNKVGTAKGHLPPGYAVVPNIMMYEVCIRDNLASASDFKTASENNVSWIFGINFYSPAYTKGQRMNEYIPFHALTWAYETHPEMCPSYALTRLTQYAEMLISRSNNLWDYTQYTTKGDTTHSEATVWVNLEAQGSGLCNNPGYVGMMGVYFALARCVEDEGVKARLKQLAMSHLDHGFGRNPLGRCFDYKATDDFEDAKLGWVKREAAGVGHLNNCIAVLDGSPKNENFPYNPNGSTGYTEGWVAFNSAWNFGLAYYRAESGNGIGIFA